MPGQHCGSRANAQDRHRNVPVDSRTNIRSRSAASHGPLAQAARRRRGPRPIRRQPHDAQAGRRLGVAPLAREGRRIRLHAGRRGGADRERRRDGAQARRRRRLQGRRANGHCLVNRRTATRSISRSARARRTSTSIIRTSTCVSMRDEEAALSCTKTASRIRKIHDPPGESAGDDGDAMTFRISSSTSTPTASRSSPGTCPAAR